MVPTNDFLPFCPTDTGTNLLSNGDYAIATDRTSGNKPGIASAKLNNKAIRQSAFVTSQVAQFVSDQLGASVLDDAISAKILSQLMATLKAYPPKLTKYTTGSGTHGLTYIFFIASGSASSGATYTNNAHTFTVVATVTAGTVIQMTGDGDPAVSGTLTKSGGSGDATLTFYAMRKPVYLGVQMVGAGGGGGGSGTGSSGAGTGGGDTTFGTTLLSAGGGAGGNGGSSGSSSGSVGGPGGASSLGSGPVGTATTGNTGIYGGNSSTTSKASGGVGGASALGGSGAAGVNSGGTGGNAATNSGSGGGGGGSVESAGFASGGGGGAGGYVNAMISSPLATYAYAVGSKGTGGSSTSTGGDGGDGADGVIVVQEHYQ